MEDRLAVIANEVDASRSDFELLARGKDSVGVDVPEAEVQLTEFAGGDGVLLGHTKDFFTQGRGELE